MPYAPENSNEEESDLFYPELQRQLDMYKNMYHVVVAGLLMLQFVIKLLKMLLESYYRVAY